MAGILSTHTKEKALLGFGSVEIEQNGIPVKVITILNI